MLRHDSPHNLLNHGDFRDLAVTMIVPCFNEQESVDQLLVKLDELTNRLQGYSFQFLIVDDGSSDETVARLQHLTASKSNFTVLRHSENLGVAAAIMTGLRAAKTEVCCSMDFDCSYEPLQFEPMIPMIAEAHLVTASPYHPEGRVRNVPSWRLWVSRGASFAYGMVIDQKVHTYTSCFRVYRQSAVAGIELENPGFVGVAELLYRLDQKSGIILECPATLDVRKYGQSKMRVAQVTKAHLRFLTKAMRNRFFGSSRPTSLKTIEPIETASSADTKDEKELAKLENDGHYVHLCKRDGRKSKCQLLDWTRKAARR